MRRIALLAALTAGGCGTLGNAPVAPGVATRVEGAARVGNPAEGDAPAGPRFGREAVPNSVMLQSQLDSGFRDAVVP